MRSTIFVAAVVLAACTASPSVVPDSGTTPDAGSDDAGVLDAGTSDDAGVSDAGFDAGVPCGVDPVLPEETLSGTQDPEHGVFTMEQALEGLPEGSSTLRAIIDTDLGTLTCELRPDAAPIGTANFVGLARGTRPFKDPVSKKWVKRRFYDGLLFHRVIPDFVIQGGDPLGTGYGGPGYQFANEQSDLNFDAGMLAYANAGAGTNGSQFFVTVTPQHQLDGDYTIFGACVPLDLVATMASVDAGTGDRPVVDLHMKTVAITRCP